MTQTNIEQDKIDFETWHNKEFGIEFCDLRVNANGVYVDAEIDLEYTVWQAALKLQRERQASGEAVAWNFEYDQLTEEFIHELDDKTAMTISGFNRGSWAQYFNSQKNHPPKDSTKLFTAPQQANIPDGWKLVPIEPTDEMIEASMEVTSKILFGNYSNDECTNDFERAKKSYLLYHKATLNSSPKQPIESDNKVREALEAAINIAVAHAYDGKHEYLVEKEIRALIPNTQADKEVK